MKKVVFPTRFQRPDLLSPRETYDAQSADFTEHMIGQRSTGVHYERRRGRDL